MKALPWLLAALILLAGCGRSPTGVGASPTGVGASLSAAFPAANAVPGWGISSAARVYDHDHLYELVDGQADAFFAFNFQQAAVQRYQDSSGNLLNLEIWQLASPVDACGLFLSNQSGKPAALGVEGRLNSGRRLSFWQDRYYVAVTVSQPVPDETLSAFAGGVSGKLPAGGSRPAILARLPAQGLVADGALYFHLEITVQNDVWLGGKNILGLSVQTAGALGRYALNGKKAVLLVIEYPDEAAAQKGLQALQGGGVKKLLGARASGKLLAAAFGDAAHADAQGLLDQALK